MDRRHIHQLIKEESGQDLIEYSLVAALLSLCAIASMRGLARVISNSFNLVTNNLAANI